MLKSAPSKPSGPPNRIVKEGELFGIIWNFIKRLFKWA